ncbi:MAG TPA: prepilin-type N-terminal cleavage/methylation domain-containing protein [Azospirillaceae bacterium]|nr:prepilin-type N-terminal cleavage/methylation domain-containing protein [Azospirillaceae bacterium]
MTDPVPPTGRGDAGFTLLEMLVAMTVLALVLAAAAGALGFLGQGFGRATDRVERVEQAAVARDVLRRQLARGFPLVEGGVDDGRYVFTGERNALTFVIAEPPAPGRGGLSVARFTIEPGEGGDRLTYGQRRLAGGEERTSPLLDGPYRLSFEYFGSLGPAQPPAWRPDWPDRRRLPLLVRLRISADGRELPAAVAGFRADAERGCALALGEGFCRDFVDAPP